LFISAASLVEIEAVTERIRHRDAKRADALHQWLDGLVATFRDRSTRSTSTSQFGRADSCPIGSRATMRAIAYTTRFVMRRRSSMATAS
jgi:hypothetical protein